MSEPQPDPDRLVKKIYAARAAQQGIDQSWPDLPDHAQSYWRDLVDVMRPVFKEAIEEELRTARPHAVIGASD
jgi:hypothetical protein